MKNEIDEILKSYGYTIVGKYAKKNFSNGGCYAILRNNLDHLTLKELKEQCEDIDDIFGARETRNDYGIPGIQENNVNIKEV